MKRRGSRKDADAEKGRSDSDMGTTTSSRSFQLESWAFVQRKDFQVHLMRKVVKVPSNRPTIATTESQRLAFFRGYATSPFKIQRSYLQQDSMADFFWIYIKNVLFRSLPMNYLHAFFASYNPDDHFFSSKIAPLCYGASWQIVICTILQLVASCDIIALLFVYTQKGFLMSELRYTVQRLGYLNVLKSKKYEWAYINFLFIWTLAALFYKQLFKKYIWNIFMYLQLIMVLMYGATLVYTTTFFFDKTDSEYKREPVTEVVSITKEWDFDFLAESFSAPPVLQLLTSRSGHRVHPSRDSFIITASNGLFYFFQCICNYKLKSYVESKIQLPLWFSHINSYPMFICWPWFFYLSMGRFAARIFFVIQLSVECLLFIITFQILVEILACEWKFARRWVSSILLSTVGITLNSVLAADVKFLAYAVTTSITALTEVVIVCWLYPLDRLTDDINFHFGSPVGFIRIWSFRLLPIYHIYKLFYLYSGLERMQRMCREKKEFALTMLYDSPCVYWIWVIGVTPLVLGCIFAVLKYVVTQKQTWRVLLRPRPDWGPREHVTRQLRKQFDSREYIGSHASRYLSRHLLAKAQTPAYRLDIKYLDDRRKSVVVADNDDPPNDDFGPKEKPKLFHFD